MSRRSTTLDEIIYRAPGELVPTCEPISYGATCNAQPGGYAETDAETIVREELGRGLASNLKLDKFIMIRLGLIKHKRCLPWAPTELSHIEIEGRLDIRPVYVERDDRVIVRPDVSPLNMRLPDPLPLPPPPSIWERYCRHVDKVRASLGG